LSFLLDTNVVSEWAKVRPDPGVIRWLDEADEDRVYLSVVTLAELRYGIEALAAGERRGHPINAMDAMLAATAEVHAPTLVTRNVSEFKLTLKSIVNPWS
jgi:predicted nucleic acid-binding protein